MSRHAGRVRGGGQTGGGRRQYFPRALAQNIRLCTVQIPEKPRGAADERMQEHYFKNTPSVYSATTAARYLLENLFETLSGEE